MGLRDRVAAAFRERFGEPPPLLARAPGRVNLVGEHTDYNDGFVLPMAIAQGVAVALRPRLDRRVVVRAADRGAEDSFDLDEVASAAPAPQSRARGDWTAYLRGTGWALAADGWPLRGWEGVLAGDVPIGAGLSSSAALELAVARAFAAVSGAPWDPLRAALACRRAEGEWVGMRCGIMDQLAAAAGRAGHALLVDCRSLDIEPVALPAGVGVAVLDTATRRELTSSAYNERREECEEAARRLGVAALRDVRAGEVETRLAPLPETLRRRARHVVSENARVTATADAMRAGDARTVGALMIESHRSLRDDFEVSSAALDAMVESALAAPGCLGARLTGAGFAGCAVALVSSRETEGFLDAVRRAYRARTGIQPALYLCEAADGASVMALP